MENGKVITLSPETTFKISSKDFLDFVRQAELNYPIVCTELLNAVKAFFVEHLENEDD